MELDNDFHAERKQRDYYKNVSQELEKVIGDLERDLECANGNGSLCQQDSNPSDYNETQIQMKLETAKAEKKSANEEVNILHRISTIYSI